MSSFETAKLWRDLSRKEAAQIAGLGLMGGLLSGLLGISGGVVLVPALVFLLGWNQRHAQGTALAVMLPPVGILAVTDYYYGGHVDLKVAMTMAVGIFLGGFFGGRLAGRIPANRLRKLFGLVLLIIGLKMIMRW
jgi:hypothetical protein